MMKKIKTWFRKLMLKWAHGVAKEAYDELNNKFTETTVSNVKQFNAMKKAYVDFKTETDAMTEETNRELVQCEQAVDWLREYCEKLDAENSKMHEILDEYNKMNIKTITAEVDLNTSNAWNIDDTQAIIRKLTPKFIEQLGAECIPYIRIFIDDNNYLTACVNVVEYDN